MPVRPVEEMAEAEGVSVADSEAVGEKAPPVLGDAAGVEAGGTDGIWLGVQGQRAVSAGAGRGAGGVGMPRRSSYVFMPISNS